MAKTNAQRQRRSASASERQASPSASYPHRPQSTQRLSACRRSAISRIGERRSRRCYSTPPPYPMPTFCLSSSCRDTNTRQAKTCRDNYSPPDSPSPTTNSNPPPDHRR